MEEAVGYRSLEAGREVCTGGLHLRKHINAKVVMGLGEVTKGVRIDGEEKRPRTEPGTLQH